MNRYALLLAACLTLGVANSASAGWHRYHRTVAYAAPVFDYAPYTVYGGGFSVHGPAVYHRSYYAPVSYGFRTFHRRGWGWGRPYFYGPGFGYWRSGFTRYGVYGGSFAYAPLTVGYPYATGYLSAVQPVQPYLASYRTTLVAPVAAPVVATPVVTAYSPCIYGAYGLLGY